MVPSLELGAIISPRQLTIAILLNVLRKDDDFSTILHTLLECEIVAIADTVSRIRGTFASCTSRKHGVKRSARPRLGAPGSAKATFSDVVTDLGKTKN
jgi:hypothetical protein